jgi:hypothetical protein
VCTVCHDGLVTRDGTDYSFAAAWRPSMMANAARDPYWQASVRREMQDHPDDAAAIEDECSTCHMPMAHVAMCTAGRPTSVFDNVAALSDAEGMYAADGVSCTVCHQIAQQGLGRPESFTGRFVLDQARDGTRVAFGPYRVMHGAARMMWSASGYMPAAAPHNQSSDLCGTCHTVYNHIGDTAGGRGLAEQTPYLEWLHSEYRTERSCQSCHMEEIEGYAPLSNYMGHARGGISRHDFRGANVFMLRLLAAHSNDLAVLAPPLELERAQTRTLAYLTAQSASLDIVEASAEADRVTVVVAVTDQAGHKLPTGYASRRAWLHVVVRAGDGSTVFESGKPLPDGRIEGNENDSDRGRFEPHYQSIDGPEQVQVYEAVLGDRRGAMTTGPTSAVTYLKDNRLVPRGFDKSTAPPDVAVHGHAVTDPDFGFGTDRVRYSARVGRARGPYRADVELRYQTIGYRWADDLRGYAQAEPKRFAAMHVAAAPISSVVLARSEREITAVGSRSGSF